VFVDGDLELRFAARPTNGPQVPHHRDELYFVASGSGRYRVEDSITAVGPGDVLFCAAHVAHGFEEISDDFSVWVLFYGPQKQMPLGIALLPAVTKLPRILRGDPSRAAKFGSTSLAMPRPWRGEERRPSPSRPRLSTELSDGIKLARPVSQWMIRFFFVSSSPCVNPPRPVRDRAGAATISCPARGAPERSRPGRGGFRG
jgi:hypothetical protein